MAIHGLSAIGTQPVFPSPNSLIATKTGAPQADFGQIVRQAVGHVDQEQQQVAMSVQDLLTGRNQDILPVVTEVAKADMSFKLLMGVRNKVIEAYKQTINMQI